MDDNLPCVTVADGFGIITVNLYPGSVKRIPSFVPRQNY